MKVNTFLSALPFFGKVPQQQQAQKTEKIVEKETIKVVREVDTKSLEEIRKAREEINEFRRKTDLEIRKQKEEVQDLDRQIKRKEDEVLTAKVKLDQEYIKFEAERKQLAEKREEILAKLEKVARINQSEARELILKGWEEKLKKEIAEQIKNAEEKIKAEADKKAQEILVDAMKHGATDYITEYTISTVAIPNDEVKGRIIGKEGRNIRSFELATGVDVDLEEEGVIKISSFDAYKREIAKTALERLIKDGRVQPVRIEEIVKETKAHLNRLMLKAGEDLVHRVGVYDLPNDLVELLGRFKYRFSYGQNLIEHTLEETKIGIALAHELKANVMTVKLGCLFHDIGKVVDDKEGSHVQLGAELIKKHGFKQEVVHCIEAHHEDIPFQSVEAMIVYIADAISGARPGARHEDFDLYLKRIKDIENIATSKKGVKEAYALQAGRELRVIVKPEDITDDDAVVLSEKIRQEINEKFPVFPGQVTITVIRETRAVATSHS